MTQGDWHGTIEPNRKVAHMDIEGIAEKIAKTYIKDGADMNGAIAKYASDNSLSIEHTKRLIEETNKKCYLMKFAESGEQVFDVADFKKVKDIAQLKEGQEKTANIKSIQIDSIDYGDFNKTANEINNIQNAGIVEIRAAIEKCKRLAGSEMSKMASLKSKLIHLNPDMAGLTLEKMAEHEGGKTLRPSLARIQKYDKIIEHLEKAAFVGAVAGAALRGGAAVGGSLVKTVIKHPMDALMVKGFAGSAKGAAKNTYDKVTHSTIGNMAELPKHANEITKEADGFGASLMEAAKGAAPYLLATGIAGVGVAAARKMGGIASRMMQERQLNQAFDTIHKNDAELRQIPSARQYFDVIARHSPTLALDPMVAPHLIKKMDSFGGVDLNTISTLRNIENFGAPQTSSLDIANTMLGAADKLNKFKPEGPDLKLQLERERFEHQRMQDATNSGFNREKFDYEKQRNQNTVDPSIVRKTKLDKANTFIALRRLRGERI